MLRAVSSEGSIQIDGKKHLIGGLAGQPERAYIEDKWIENMTTIPESFLVEDFEISPIKEDINGHAAVGRSIRKLQPAVKSPLLCGVTRN